MDWIKIQGARTHNLKNISLTLPRNKLIVITGLSGSGKSSLAFDTLYAEGQRRYVESLSVYARQFLSLMEKPDVDSIEGLSPAISIEQKSSSHNPRSTVGTTTEIYDYLRLLFARAGEPRCPKHQLPLIAQTISQMVDYLDALPQEKRYMLLAPLLQQRKGEHSQLLNRLANQGFIRVRIDGAVYELSDLPKLAPEKRHTIEVVVDRFKIHPENRQRLAESLETAIELSKGTALVVSLDAPAEETIIFSANFTCPHCGYSLDELEPRLFSFNNPLGACPDCDGLGVQQFFDPERVVQNPGLSLAGGAVRGWDRRNLFYFQMLCSLADHYKFDLHQPFNLLPEKIRELVLTGSASEPVPFQYTNSRGINTIRHHPFEGILRTMERRYQESDSLAVREDLAQYINQRSCLSCQGSRLREAARSVYIGGKTIPEVTRMSIADAHLFFTQLELMGQRAAIAEKILQTVCERLQFLNSVGLSYLTLERSAETLSGGEAQRIRLASQVGSGLVGVMYVLDEPSIGLHQRDNSRLLNTLTRLRDLGNTVIVVEHDEEAIRNADHIVDMGPGAGVHGGSVVAQGSLEEIIAATNSVTGEFLSGRRAIAIPEQRTLPDKERQLLILGASGNNLKNVDLALPVSLFTCVTGVSGSGKSTLINDTLFRIAHRKLNRGSGPAPKPYRSIEGLEHFDKVIDIDQSPIGRTPRSNPATYAGLFTFIRELFASTPESRSRGYSAGRFSFNVRGGRCEACQGDGLVKVEMHFLPDLYVPCDQCKGKRYNRETLEVQYKGRSIHQVLEMTVEDASDFFAPIPTIKRKLDTLVDVGLSYLRLGQAATTLSGGEAQRVKLARELSKRGTGRTLYILDEPTTGLHFADIQQLLAILHRLREQGNTVVVIEHNLDVIKTADWVVDLGPEGGNGGGEILVSGPPELVAADPRSATGQFLQPMLQKMRQ